MPALTVCNLDNESVGIDKALALVASGTRPGFRCPECSRPVRPHKAGGKMPAHFEHLARNSKCSLSHVERRSATSDHNGWTDEELRASVAAYLSMLDQLRAKSPVVKQHVYLSLAQKFNRTPGSFEYRMQNISYVLSLLGREWIPGLPPARNVGANVASKIEAFIAQLEGRSMLPVAAFEVEVEKALKRSGAKPGGNKTPKASTVSVTQFERDPKVKAWVLKQAKGVCECCSLPAPFVTVSGPFLEVHHLQRLADGGADTTENAVAICPNCHRRLHYGVDAIDFLDSLYKKVPRLVRA